MPNGFFAAVRVNCRIDGFQRPGRTGQDPLLQQRFLRSGKRVAIFRHVVVLRGLPQRAFGQFAGDDSLFALAAGERERFSRQIQLTFLG